MEDSRKTILVVDDEEDVRLYLSCLLEDNHYTVITASDGVKGLEVLTHSTPDLVTLDVTMPHKSGISLYREMRETFAWQEIPVIIVSGIASEFERYIIERPHIPKPQGISHKPVDREKLLGLIRILLM